jgi:hypothetical protein
MNTKGQLLPDLIKSALWTIFLTVLFFVFCLKGMQSTAIFTDLILFVVLYFVVFSIGKKSIVVLWQNWIKKNSLNDLVFPTLMLISYILYLLIHHQNPLQGNPLLGLYLIYFPTMAFALHRKTSPKIGWFDFTVFAATILPGAFFSIDQPSEIPFTGGGFDSLFHVIIVLSGVYAFAIVRGIGDVGFFPEFKWRSLLTALMAWMAFYALVVVFGGSIGFIQYVGYQEPFNLMVKSILIAMIGTYLHTALFEELFFRGILQNMLMKRIGQAKSWKIFWTMGFVLLLVCAVLVGYTLEGKMKWFPALVTIALFGTAYFIEKSRKFDMGTYTALALTSVTFGLVHYHAKSIIYIGLACIAGWAYGYTYIKTKNVFYSALVHMLVNTSVLFFGLKMVR